MNTTEDSLKKTLAHEYGHHWTITNCLRNHWSCVTENSSTIREQRLPNQYYIIRGLDETNYFPDDSRGWFFCDREVIAEDYRVLFAPHPYNQFHIIVEEMKNPKFLGTTLNNPESSVKDYIYGLRLPLS